MTVFNGDRISVETKIVYLHKTVSDQCGVEHIHVNMYRKVQYIKQKRKKETERMEADENKCPGKKERI